MIIRAVQGKDFSQIFQMYMQGYDEAEKNPNFGDVNRLKRPSPQVARPWAKNLYGDVLKGNVVYIVAEEKGKVFGFCFVKKKDIPDSELSHVGILGIRVLSGMRGRGIGTKLMKEMLRRAKKKFDVLEISVISNNTGAKKLYRRLGFKVWGVAPRYVKRNGRYIDQDYMYLRL